jgi:hypothetical protein
MEISRREKVAMAWANAYRKIGAEVDLFCERHGPPPNCLDLIREYAPSRAQEIEEAEQVAERAAVEWAKGGQGGVQAKIDAWVKLWIEGLREISSAR